ncbi:MAG: hypothetical protein QOH26_130 [Actinomycetota bacterium]|nr:hypothetical protein [Actinomycetota bacterium]
MNVRTGTGTSMDENQVLRWGGAAAMVGAGLILVGNLLHPRISDPGNVRDELEAVADSGIWVFDHFLIAWALGFLFVGLIAITSYLDGGTSSTMARIARASVVGGVVVAFIAVSVDGMAMKTVADEWMASGATDVTFATANAVNQISLALFTALIGSFAGLSPVLITTAQLQSKRFAPWVCYLGMAGGLVCLAVSSIMVFAGPSGFVSNVLFTAGSLAVTVWVFMSGLHLWQRASEGAAT